eukprot:5221040-Pleurochrysis_carterae.AAC.2
MEIAAAKLKTAHARRQAILLVTAAVSTRARAHPASSTRARLQARASVLTCTHVRREVQEQSRDARACGREH